MPRVQDDSSPLTDRIQIGVKMEKRMVKVLKAVAEYHDISLGEMLESLVLHAFANKLPFDQNILKRIEQLKIVYEMDYDYTQGPRFTEEATVQPKLLP